MHKTIVYFYVWQMGIVLGGFRCLRSGVFKSAVNYLLWTWNHKVETAN